MKSTSMQTRSEPTLQTLSDITSLLSSLSTDKSLSLIVSTLEITPESLNPVYNKVIGSFRNRYKHLPIREIHCVCLAQIERAMRTYNPARKTSFASWVFNCCNFAIIDYLRQEYFLGTRALATLKQKERRNSLAKNGETVIYPSQDRKVLLKELYAKTKPPDAAELWEFLTLGLGSSEIAVAHALYQERKTQRQLAQEYRCSDATISRMVNATLLPHFRKRMELLN